MLWKSWTSWKCELFLWPALQKWIWTMNSLEHIGINTEDGKWVLFVCLYVTGLVAYVRKQCQSSRKWIMFMCNRFGCVYVCVWLHKSLSSRNRRAMNSRVDETHVTSPGSKLRYSSIRWNQEDVSPSGRIFLVSVFLCHSSGKLGRLLFDKFIP